MDMLGETVVWPISYLGCACSAHRVSGMVRHDTRGFHCAGGMTVESRNLSHLAELIPHHNHTSLDGLNPVDILKPTHGRYAALLRASGVCPHDHSYMPFPRYVTI